MVCMNPIHLEIKPFKRDPKQEQMMQGRRALTLAGHFVQGQFQPEAHGKVQGWPGLGWQLGTKLRSSI